MILLKFDKAINGESEVAGHENWINVSSIQLGVGRSISAVGGGGDRETSNPSFSEVTLSRSTDKASQDLMIQACGGKSLGKATIDFIQTGGDAKGQVYLQYVFDDTIVSSYSVSSGGDRPSESVSLNFTKMKMTFNAFTGGVVTKGVANVAGTWSRTRSTSSRVLDRTIFGRFGAPLRAAPPAGD